MAEDLFGRQTESYSVSDLSQAMMEAVTTVVETASPGTDERLDELYSSINVVAQSIDNQARQDLESARQYVDAIINMRNELSDSTRRQESNSQNFQQRAVEYLRDIAQSTRVLNRASGEQWVAISRLSAQAQRDIAAAIRMSDCCSKAASTVIPATQTQVSSGDYNLIPASQVVLAQGVGQAVGQALSRSGVGERGGGGGRVAGGLAGPPGGTGGVAKMQKWGAALELAASTLSLIGRTLANLLEVDLGNILPSVKDENRFRLAMREAVFLTRGFGKYNRELEESYRDIGNEVMASGQYHAQFQAAWMQNLQRGLRMNEEVEKSAVKQAEVGGKQLRLDEQEERLKSAQVKRMKDTTATALNTAKMLGMDMGVVNEQFMDWQMHLGFSANSVAALGRHMRTVAEQSGVYGKNMEQVLKHVDEIAQGLKSSGNLTAGAMKQSMSMMAELDKLGVADEFKPWMKALGSYHDLMVEADDETRQFLINAAKLASIKFKDDGLVQRIMSGEFYGNVEDAKKLLSGMEDTVKSMMQRSGVGDLMASVGLDLDNMKLKDIEKAHQRLKSEGRRLTELGRGEEAQKYFMASETMNSIIKQYSGKGIGDFARWAEAADASTKTASENITDLKKQLEGLKPGKVFDEKSAKLLDLEARTYMDVFDKIREQASFAGGTLDDAAKEYARVEIGTNIGKEFASSVGNMEGAAETLLDKLGKKASASGRTLADMLEERGFSASEIKKQLASGEQLQIEGAQSVLNSVMRELGVKEKTGEDAITELMEEIRTLNSRLNKWLGGKLDILGNNPMLARLLLVGTAIANAIATLLVWVGGLYGLFKAGTWIKGLLFGSRAAATGAGAGSGAAASTMSRAMGNSADDLARAAGNLTDDAARAAGATAGLTDDAARAGTILGGKAASKFFAAVGPILSGIFGGKEAEQAGKSFAEGAGFGALTGGGTTKSMLGGLVGTKEGGAADKTLALGESAVYGALAGGAIGAAPGAAIGAIVAPLIKGVQMLGEKYQWVADMAGTIINPLGYIIEGIWNMVKGVWDIIAGIFTLDIGRIGTGIKKISKVIWSLGAGILKSITWQVQGVITAFLNIPSILKSIFLDFPSWLYKTILGGLTSLADNEWIGPIIEPFKVLWETLGELWSAIGTPIKEIFDTITEALQPAIDAVSSFFDGVREFFGIEKAAGGLSDILEGLTWVLKGVAKIVGFVIKVALTPLIMGIKAVLGIWRTVQNAISLVIQVFAGIKGPFEAIAEFVGGIIDGIAGAFKWLWDFLVGHSIIPDLIKAIVMWFAKLPIMIPMYLAKVMLGIAKSVLRGAGKIFGKLWEGLKKVPGILWEGFKIVAWKLPMMFLEGLKKVFWDFPKWLLGQLWNGLMNLGDLIKKGVSAAWDWVKEKAKAGWEWLKNLPSAIWSGMKDLATRLYEGLTEALGQSWDWMKNKFDQAEEVVNTLTGSQDIVQNIEETNKAMQASQQKHDANIDARVASTKDLDKKIAELEGLLGTAKVSLAGAEKNVSLREGDVKDLDSWVLPNWSGMDSGYNAATAALDSARTTWDDKKKRVEALESQLAAAKAEKKKLPDASVETKAAEVTAKTMEAGLRPGSIYVHDTHVERVLVTLGTLLTSALGSMAKMFPGVSLEQTGAFDPTSVKEAALESQAEIVRKETSVALSGATGPLSVHDEKVENAINRLSEKRSKEVASRQAVAPENKGAFEAAAAKEAISGVMEQMSNESSNARFARAATTPEIGGDPNAERLMKGYEEYSKQLESRKNLASYTSEGAFDARTSLPDAMSTQPMIEKMKGLGVGAEPLGLWDTGDKERLSEAFRAYQTDERRRELASYAQQGAFDTKSALPDAMSIRPLIEKMRGLGVEDEQIKNLVAQSGGNLVALTRAVEKVEKSLDEETKTVTAEPGGATDYGKTPSGAAEKALAEKIKVDKEQTEGYFEYLKRMADSGKFGTEGVDIRSKANPGTALNYEQAASKAAEGLMLKTKYWEVDMSNLKEADKLPEPKSPEVSLSRSLDYEKAASEADERNLVANTANAFSEREEPTEKRNIVAELSRTLDYEKAASEAEEARLGQEWGTDSLPGSASPTILDYSDSLKPMVEPLMVSRAGVEDRLEQDRYSEQPSIGGMLPSMSEIADYLVTEQAATLGEMVILLREIKDRMAPGNSSTIVGAKGGGIRPMNRPGVKNIAQDLTRGHWDLTFNEHSVGTVTTDGRGGSA